GEGRALLRRRRRGGRAGRARRRAPAAQVLARRFAMAPDAAVDVLRIVRKVGPPRDPLAVAAHDALLAYHSEAPLPAGCSGAAKPANHPSMTAAAPAKPIAELAQEFGLKPDEYERIVHRLNREPNLVELGVFSVMWSEHCSYKSSRKHLRK